MNPRLIDVCAVMRITDLPWPELEKLESQGRFPRRVQGSAYDAAQVETWLKNRVAGRDSLALDPLDQPQHVEILRRK
jgi:predicted DNA-binding transcriptional regulator AlpA